jgi:glycosyltransferase involved in cell wall biosynthesis
MQPDISVVVPIYGVEKYLKQCVDSILNQTFKNMEVILVDDGSRDRCPQMVDEYAAQDARVVAIHQPNGGYGKAVNAGIARARGKYIGIIESDDWIAPDMYEKLFAQAEKTGAEITKGNFYWVTNSAKGEMFLFKPWTELAKCGEVFTLEEKPNLFMDHSSLWSALYRRDFLEKHHIRFQESAEACYQDWPFCADVYSAAESITMLPEPFVYYRNDTDNTNSSSQVRNRKLIKIIHQALCARDILIANKAYGQGGQGSLEQTGLCCFAFVF